MNATEVDIRSEIEGKLRKVEAVVRDLEAKIARLNEELGEEIHRYDVIKEFYRLECGDKATPATATVDDGPPLFTMPKRFENVTIREACRQLLKERGTMHAAEIAAAITDGGRATSSTGVTSVIVRGKEFGRVEGRPNTFYLIKEVI